MNISFISFSILIAGVAQYRAERFKVRRAWWRRGNVRRGTEQLGNVRRGIVTKYKLCM